MILSVLLSESAALLDLFPFKFLCPVQVLVNPYSQLFFRLLHFALKYARGLLPLLDTRDQFKDDSENRGAVGACTQHLFASAATIGS